MLDEQYRLRRPGSEGAPERLRRADPRDRPRIIEELHRAGMI